MEKEFKDRENLDFQYGDYFSCQGDDTFDGEKDSVSFRGFEINDAPDLLRKSVERFLIGNVV